MAKKNEADDLVQTGLYKYTGRKEKRHGVWIYGTDNYISMHYELKPLIKETAETLWLPAHDAEELVLSGQCIYTGQQDWRYPENYSTILPTGMQFHYELACIK